MNHLRRSMSNLLKKCNQRRTNRLYSVDLYEPPYLEAMKSKIPLYDTLNIQIRGYDYPVLEKFQKFIHGIARNMDVNVEECWAVPAQDMQITTLKPNSEVVNSQYMLKIYERTVQVTDISTLQLPTLLRAVEAATPAGVTVQVVPHEDYHEEICYIPDKQLINLKQELEGMGGAKKTK